MKSLQLLFCLVFPFLVNGQDFTSFFTGDSNDVVKTTIGGICLMGGATESDDAMKWFLNKANGGDVLVIRASGSNGYNTYLYSQLGISVNSVQTIVFNNANASNDAYVQSRIAKAEAIWIAGGDQWNYISYWRNSPIATLINDAINTRKIAIGGTSAGMAILGQYYFTAQNGTVTSADALANPYDSKVTVDSASFIKKSILKNTTTDTHFDNPDRKGRTLTFLARTLTDKNVPIKSIACDEYTAVCIEPSGIAKVFGGHPTYDDIAYFIQPNCEIDNNKPESCTANTPLTWNQNSKAVKVYKVYGTANGANTFDLNDWKTGSGGQWQNWSIANGTITEVNDIAINCNPLDISSPSDDVQLNIFPNPVQGQLKISSANTIDKISINDMIGKFMYSNISFANTVIVNTNNWPVGIYNVTISSNGQVVTKRVVVE